MGRVCVCIYETSFPIRGVHRGPRRRRDLQVLQEERVFGAGFPGQASARGVISGLKLLPPSRPPQCRSSLSSREQKNTEPPCSLRPTTDIYLNLINPIPSYQKARARKDAGKMLLPWWIPEPPDESPIVPDKTPKWEIATANQYGQRIRYHWQ